MAAGQDCSLSTRSPLETRTGLHFHGFPASQRRSLQFAKNLLLRRRRRRKGRRKGEEGKILGLGRANAANSAQNTIPLDAYFIHCTKPIDTTSHFIVRGGGGTLRVKEDTARKMPYSYSVLFIRFYFICPWAILVAASIQ